MNGEDDLELLRRRRMLELHRRLLSSKMAREKEKPESRVESIDETLNRVFVGRAWEVLRAAEQQHPRITENLKKLMARLVKEGRVNGTVSGEQLMWLFRKIGLKVRLETKIRIYKSGELKSIADKLREDWPHA